MVPPLSMVLGKRYVEPILNGAASNFIGDGRVRRAALVRLQLPLVPHFLSGPSYGGQQWSGVATRGSVDA